MSPQNFFRRATMMTIDEKRSWSPSLQRSVLSVVNDLQRTYIQIKKLQGPLGNRQGHLSGNCRTLIVFAEFPGAYKAGRTMVLMEDEDVLPTKSLYIFFHEYRTFFHPSLPDHV